MMSNVALDDVADECVELTRALLADVTKFRDRKSRSVRRRFERLFRDPAAIEVTMALTDQVMRAASPSAAVELFRRASSRATIRGFGLVNALGLWVLRPVSIVMPQTVLRVVHWRIRRLSRELILDSSLGPLRRHLQVRREQGIAMNVNVLGEAVLGDYEGRERLAAIVEMMSRPEVDYVSVKLSSIVAQLSALDVDGSQARAAHALREVYHAAQRYGVFVNLDMEEYRDLDLTVRAFQTVLDDEEFLGLSAGIVLQAYLPESHDAFDRLVSWAHARRERGGVGIKIRIVKGANLAMELAEAELHGWLAAPYGSKADVDASYLGLLDRALRPDVASSVRIGVASHNLFHVAFALCAAQRRDVTAQLDIEMLEGMANDEARALVARGHRVLLYAPVTKREDFAAAVAYLVRRLDENTSPENYLRAAFDIDRDRMSFERQSKRFVAALTARHDVVVSSRRHHERPLDVGAFHNHSDVDPTDEEWRSRYFSEVASICREAALRIPLVIDGVIDERGEFEVGVDPNADGASWYQYRTAALSDVERAVAAARVGAEEWGNFGAAGRRAVLRRAASEMWTARERTMAVMARDTGKTAHEAGGEVSEGADFAAFYAEHVVEDDESTALGVVVVVPPWNFPYAIPAGGVLAALAGGNGVILKPAPEAVAVAWELVRQLWRAGVPSSALHFVPTRDDDVGRALVSHPDVNAVILTGSFDTARLFTSWRDDVNLLGETSGKNATVISRSADVDSAVKDLVDSAFSHAGQKCSASSLAIVDESVLRNGSFLRQLRDAVESLEVGPATRASSVVGPLIRPPDATLRRALTQLDEGESWLVAPRQRDEAGYLWSPGVRLGVTPGSWSHHHEWFGPVLAVMSAPDIETATAWQNAVDFGLTAGLQSLDERECEWWVDHAAAGNVYINRGTTGAVVQRQPFGGWKRSTVGPTAKAGGDHYVNSLRRWDHLGDVTRALNELEAWWRDEGAVTVDPSQLRVERNVHRFAHYPKPVVVRMSGDWDEGAERYLSRWRELSGLRVELSTATSIVTSLPQRVESVAELVSRARSIAKVRWWSEESAPARELLETGVVLDRRPLVQRADVEGPRWLLEQSVAVADHRYGNVGAGPRPTLRGLGERRTAL